ncbi:MAG: toll/interleukin-1 receptor domain-containing protein [Prevotellaceae bacterium]|jgi:hypothetical protein|nr:toll/interleukin-1 receptor domain-containing protein [Prevotellaceae bacterium]
MAHDIFISYSTKNSNTANAICHVLEENKIKCWMAPRDITPGNDYAECIAEAIDNCRIFLLIFSESSQASKWVKGELNVAFDSNKIIIPFKVENTLLRGAMKIILNDKHWLEAYPNPELKFKELIEISKKLLPQDSLKNKKISEGKKERNKNTGKSYDFLQNSKGDICLMIDSYEGEPENPRIIYDGRDKMVLYRSRKSIVLLDNIDEEARFPLLSVERILIAEFEGDGQEREYHAPVKIVKNIDPLI